MLVSSILVLPEEVDIPECQICRKKEVRPGILEKVLRRGGRRERGRRASVVITVRPMISQWKKGKGKEIYLCNKHYRMLLRAFDEVVDRVVEVRSGGGHLPM